MEPIRIVEWRQQLERDRVASQHPHHEQVRHGGGRQVDTRPVVARPRRALGAGTPAEQASPASS